MSAVVDHAGSELASKVGAGADPEAVSAAPRAAPGTPPDWRDGRTESFEGLYADIIAHFNRLSNVFLVYRLADLLVLKRRGIDQRSGKGAALTGLLSGTARLSLPLVLTASVGQWQGAPVWRWTVIAVVLGLLDFMTCRTAATHPVACRRTIVHESDLRQLAAFDQRWYRLRWSAVAAVTLTSVILLLTWVLAHTSLSELPIGSSALLLIILYEVGEMAFFSLYHWAASRRDAKVAHRLPWFSPVDSVPIQSDLRAFTESEFARGLGTTTYLLMTVVLLSLDSPLLLPIAIALIATGYVGTLISITAIRSSLRKIVRHVQEDHLALLERRITSFGPEPSELTAEDLEQVRGLIALYKLIDDAPTSPTRKQSLLHAAGGLAIPTVTFLAAVFAQEYAGRILDRLLP